MRASVLSAIANLACTLQLSHTYTRAYIVMASPPTPPPKTFGRAVTQKTPSPPALTFGKATPGASSATSAPSILSVNPIVTFTTSAGTIRCELFLSECPITVSNFVDLAEKGFYNNLHFHRVVPSFIAQFGCPYAKDPDDPRAGTGGPTDESSFTNLRDGSIISRGTGGTIPDEFTVKIRNDAGTLSMANTGAPNTGGSQLFMNVNDNNVLNWYTPGDSKHPVFGKCLDVESFNVMVAISQVPTQNDRPVTPVKVSSVQVGLPSGAAFAAAAAAAAASKAAPEAPNRARQSAGRPAEPSQPSPTLASPSTPEGISWADKESKDW